MSRKPVASLSLDLDNKWSYMKVRGDERWKDFPTYLPVVVPRILEVLARRNLRITFFIVGQDAVRPENREALAMIAAAGHEIANHSFHHEPWLHLYEPERLEAEIAQAEEAIREATGRRTAGFRGPGYSYSPQLLRILARRGYEYDCSTFPTYLGPLARLYYFMTSGISGQERKQRDLLFGSWKNGLLPLEPYLWKGLDRDLLEIPVTTMPLFKVPIHPSYILYLSRFSPVLGMAYYRLGLGLAKLTGVQPSILLHPLDFLGSDDGLDELKFFPAMDMTAAAKVAIVDRMIGLLDSGFRVLTMSGHAREATSTAPLPAAQWVEGP